jgi:hypothetical protein
LSPTDIPPDCQVGNNEFVDVNGQKMLRLFWRKPGEIAFVTQDVPIGNWEPSSPLFSSPPTVLQSPSTLKEYDEDEDEDEDEDTGD